MSKRYETIKFDKFSGGEQCTDIEPTEKSFEMSNELVIQKNKIKLGKNVQGGALYDLDFIAENSKIAFLYSSSLCVLGSNTESDECMIKKINVQTGGISTTHTFSGGGNEPHCFITFRGKAIVSILDGSYKIQYATMSMVSWTNCGTIGAGLIITDYVIVDDQLFVLCNDEKIYYSDDGISFTLLVALDSVYRHDDLNYLDGYFYVRSWKTSGSNNGLVRISSAGEIQDEVISVDVIYSFKTFVFNGNLYVLIDKRFLYRVVGSSLRLIFTFENSITFINSFGIVDSAFFWDATDDKIIVMNLFEKFSRPFKVISVVDYIWMIHKYNNADTIAICGLSNIVKAIIYENKYISPGNIKTYVARLKGGLGTLKQLVLNHKPLTANAWVKVYFKKDQASTWGSALITSTDLNAVRKAYDFPAGEKCSFAQCKIEYGTDDSAETPEDATVDLIYLPIGLVNSR